MSKIVEGMTEALAVAKGEQPAARITINGHTYVPLADYERLRAALKWVHEKHGYAHIAELLDQQQAAPPSRGDMVECQKCGGQVRFGSCCDECKEPSDH